MTLAAEPTVSTPYRGLAPFGDNDVDALLFFGRERETQVVTANLIGTRLTVLYGPSGVGKSSLLQAGVTRRIRELGDRRAVGRGPDLACVVFSSWSAADPAQEVADAIAAEIRRLVSPTTPEPPAGVTLAEAAEHWTAALDGDLCLILDQVEEYFVYHQDHGPHSLVGQLAALATQQSSRTNVLLSLRDDELARLDVFKERLPHVFANPRRLDRLDRTGGEAAIRGPLEHWNRPLPPEHWVEIEPALVAAVLAQSAVAADGGRIEAPVLQLVMERLWQEERTSGSRNLRLATLERLGGAEAIVSAHLDSALGALGPRDAEIAASALAFLVTPTRRKISHSLTDLVGFTHQAPADLRPVLELLASERILRAVSEGDSGRRYEIFHDVLAEPVLAWRSEFETQRAMEAPARRHRRLAAVAIAALALSAAMILLAVYAFAQRNEASKQKWNAQVAEQQANANAAAADQSAAAVRKKNKQLKQSKKETQQKNDQLHRSNKKLNESRAQIQRQYTQLRHQNVKLEQSHAQIHKKNVQLHHETRVAQHQTQVAKQQTEVANHQTQVAKNQTQVAKHQTQLAKVGQLVEKARADLDVDPEKSVRAALDASASESSTQVEDALRDSLVALRVRGKLSGSGTATSQLVRARALRARSVLSGSGTGLSSAVFSRDGKLVATGSEDGTARVFRTRDHAVLQTFRTGSAVRQVAFSPDGTRLAVATARSRALVYDVKSGELLHSLEHGGPVLDVAFAGEGRYIVTGSADLTTRIWDASTGALLHAIHATAAQEALAISPSGSLVAVLSTGQATAHVYDVATGNLVASPTQQGALTALAFSPDGSYLVTGGRRNGYVWDAHTWAQLHLLVGHEASITDIAFAPDGRVVTGSVDFSARVWDPATGVALFTLLSQHMQKVLAVAVSPDNRAIVTTSADNTARVWQTPLGSPPLLLAGHTDSVISAEFSRDSNLLLTASEDGTARLWDPSAPLLRTLGQEQGAIGTVAYSPDGRYVLGAGADGTARIWRIGGGSAASLAQGSAVNAAAFSADGNEVLTGGEDGTAKLWRTADGSLLRTFTHGAPVRAALFVPGGELLTGGADGLVKRWSSSGRLLSAASAGSPVTVAAAAPDGTIAAAAEDGTVRLWPSGRGAIVLRGHTDTVTSLAFDRSSRLLVSGSDDDTARIWDARTGAVERILSGHAFGVTSVSFSPNGKSVLTSGGDGDARIWSVQTGKTVHRLKFHVSNVSQTAFSDDGQWVVTAGPTSAGIWQVRTGKLLYAVRGASGNLTSAQWSPDSRSIVAGDTGGGVGTYRCSVCIDLPGLRAQARERLAALR